MKEESRIRETSLNENIKEQEVSRGKVRKGFSGWLLVIMTMADLALLIAAVLCVHFQVVSGFSQAEQVLEKAGREKQESQKQKLSQKEIQNHRPKKMSA